MLSDTISQLLTLIATLQTELQTAPQFTQGDLDNAVAAATAPLNAQVASLQHQVDGMPQAIAAAVAGENARLIAIVKAGIDADEPAILAAMSAPVVATPAV